jgi:nitrite reductase/ring-hydroxylating ferredoxin subunit
MNLVHNLLESLFSGNLNSDQFLNSSINNISFVIIISILVFISYKLYAILTFDEIVVVFNVSKFSFVFPNNLVFHFIKYFNFKDMTPSKLNKTGIKTYNNTTDLPPFYPNGWIPILESRHIKVNQIKPIIAFGYELVAFRGISGEVHVLDAFCPHLGANLGVGGKVVEDCIKCPFHGWTFRGRDGFCTKVPQCMFLLNRTTNFESSILYHFQALNLSYQMLG